MTHFFSSELTYCAYKYVDLVMLGIYASLHRCQRRQEVESLQRVIISSRPYEVMMKNYETVACVMDGKTERERCISHP